MKKKIALGLVGLMVMGSVTGCGKARSKYLLNIDYSDYVKLCEYKGVEVDKVTFDVSEDEIQEQIDADMYNYATYDEITDRGIQIGDYVVIDYTAKLDGKESEDYSGSEEEILIGEEYFYPEVEDALVGMKTGDKTTVDVTLTEEYAEEGDEGKNLSLDVTVGTVTQENIPECNDEFVKENTEYASLEEYSSAVKEDLAASKEEEYKEAAVMQVLDFLVDNSTFNGYPDELYKECEVSYDEENESYAAMYGMEIDEFLDFIGLDEETKKAEIVDNVNYELVIGAVAQAEEIDCTEKEVEQFVEENYADYGYDSAEDFYEEYTKEDVGYQLIYEKVADFLYKNAKYVEIDEDTYLKQQEEMYGDEDYMEEESDDEENDEVDVEAAGTGDEEEESGENEDTESEVEDENASEAENQEQTAENADTEVEE